MAVLAPMAISAGASILGGMISGNAAENAAEAQAKAARKAAAISAASQERQQQRQLDWMTPDWSTITDPFATFQRGYTDPTTGLFSTTPVLPQGFDRSVLQAQQIAPGTAAGATTGTPGSAGLFHKAPDFSSLQDERRKLRRIADSDTQSLSARTLAKSMLGRLDAGPAVSGPRYESDEQIKARVDAQYGVGTYDAATGAAKPNAFRSTLSPEYEGIRQQALAIQQGAGRALQGGFDDIATRQLERLNALAAPREAERREALFSMLQRTGRLESTPGASIFRGAEEALANEGIRRELAADELARSERDYQTGLFSQGIDWSTALQNLAYRPSQLGIQTATAARGGTVPGIDTAPFLAAANAAALPSAARAATAAGIGQGIADLGAGIGNLFGSRSDSLFGARATDDAARARLAAAIGG